MDAATIDGRAEGIDRARAGLELLAVVGLLELELWHLRAHGPAWLNVAIYGVIVATLLLSDRRRRLAGVRPPEGQMGPARAWGESLAACLALSLILAGAALLVGDSNETFEFIFLQKPPLKLLTWLVGKFLAALAQQLALQMFLWPVCFELTRSKGGGMALAATIFGLIHLPSPTLVAITVVGGLAWIALYRRSGRIAPLVASHMILATLAHGGLPERMTYDMRVGLTATADLRRFADLADPKVRAGNRRLKENRGEMARYSTDEYFRAQGGTAEGLIRGLYRDILGREASEAEVAGWAARKGGSLRDDIPATFLGSDEYAAITARRRAASTRR